VDAFDSASAQAIAKSQAAFRNNAVKSGLIFIKTHYSTLPQVKDLETRGLSLVEYVDIFEGAKLAVEKVSGDVGKKIQTKFKDVLARNPGIHTIMDLAVIHREGVGTTLLTIKQTSSLKFAPVTSCDVERSFSHYKTILSDRQQNLLPKNIEKYLVSRYLSFSIVCII
jgi:hypothetical protein